VVSCQFNWSGFPLSSHQTTSSVQSRLATHSSNARAIHRRSTCAAEITGNFNIQNPSVEPVQVNVILLIRWITLRELSVLSSYIQLGQRINEFDLFNPWIGLCGKQDRHHRFSCDTSHPCPVINRPGREFHPEKDHSELESDDWTVPSRRRNYRDASATTTESSFIGGGAAVFRTCIYLK